VKFILPSDVAIHAHRVILARIPHFASMFDPSLKHQDIMIHLNKDAFMKLLEFLYSGTLYFPEPPTEEFRNLKEVFLKFGLERIFVNETNEPLEIYEDIKAVGQELKKSALNSSNFSDVSFVVEDKIFYAHRVILQHRSTRFHALFHAGLKETKGDKILIQDVPYEMFQKLMEFIYSESTAISADNSAVDLLLAANQYQLERLQELCEHHIDKFLDTENAAGLLELTDRLHCTQLRGSCLYFLKENWEVVQQILNIDDYLPAELKREVTKQASSPSTYEYKYDFSARAKFLDERLRSGHF